MIKIVKITGFVGVQKNSRLKKGFVFLEGMIKGHKVDCFYFIVDVENLKPIVKDSIWEDFLRNRILMGLIVIFI